MKSFADYYNAVFPSLEEWEKAARGMTGNNLPFGDDISIFDYQIFATRGVPGYQVKNNLSSPASSMSYTVSSGDTVFFDYEQVIYVN